MSAIGIAISGGPNPADMIDLVVLAERLGYESAWVAEGHGGDQFAILAACAVRTSRIRLGTSISSVFVRTAPTIAMAASTVADLSGGRFILGLGSSHKAQVEPEHGMVYTKPLTRTRQTVAVVRDLIRDGRMNFQGETIRIDSFDLWYAPRHRDVPVYLSAVFQKGIELSADGPRPVAGGFGTLHVHPILHRDGSEHHRQLARRCTDERQRSSERDSPLFGGSVSTSDRSRPRHPLRGIPDDRYRPCVDRSFLCERRTSCQCNFDQ
jgi:hypothetical protein